jgi:hypothetical protein
LQAALVEAAVVVVVGAEGEVVAPEAAEVSAVAGVASVVGVAIRPLVHRRNQRQEVEGVVEAGTGILIAH